MPNKVVPEVVKVAPKKVESTIQALMEKVKETATIYNDKVPMPTIPEQDKEEVLMLLQKAGLKLNGVDGSKDDYLVTFEIPTGASNVDPKEKLLESLFLRSSGPSVQVHRRGLSQSRGFCGFKPPKCESVAVDLRSADKGCGSQIEQTYQYQEGKDLKRTGCCGSVVDKWKFQSSDMNPETGKPHEMMFYRERNTSGCCCFKKTELPATGKIWGLLKDGNQVAQIDIPESDTLAWHCYCLPQLKGCICCGREKIPDKPQVWLRVRSMGSNGKPQETLYAIRDQQAKDKNDKDCCGCCYLKCTPRCCDFRNPSCCLAPCFSMCCSGCSECKTCCKGSCQSCGQGCKLCASGKCAESCSMGCPKCKLCCCFGPTCPPKGCCDPPELVPVYAGQGGVAGQQLKKRGQTLKRGKDGLLEHTHSIKTQLPDTPAVQPVPAQEVMVQFKFPQKHGLPSVPGAVVCGGTICDVGEAPEKGSAPKYVMHQEAVALGDEVHEGNIVAYARVDKHCCGIPCCPTCTGCPNYCVCQKIPCIGCCISCCLNPPACCGGSGEKEEMPDFTYEPVPVTGEWATGEDKKEYRVRAEVNATQAVGEAGVLLSEVVAGLEEGSDENDHLAFALVNFMEFLQDDRRPTFHVEATPAPQPSIGLPPRQQMMLGRPQDLDELTL